MLDVIIVGGGPAGLSAGLILGRFRRSVLICDSGQPRNAKASGIHGLLTREGIPPREFLEIARAELGAYATVEIQDREIVDIKQVNEAFEVYFQNGQSAKSRKLLFASGVKDALPSIEGLAQLFGKSVFHCPYCHGWEARDKAIAILANEHLALHFAELLYSLSKNIIICTNGDSLISPADHAHILEQGIEIIETPIERLDYQDNLMRGLVFADGSYVKRDVAFVSTKVEQHSLLPVQLGCELTEHGHVLIDLMGKTSVAGVYAAGDLVNRQQQVLFAMAAGASSAAAINTELASEKFR